MRPDVVAAPAGDPLERRLECWVLERLDLAAVAAHEVVVMLASGESWLVACNSVAKIDSLDKSALVQALESAVDARDPDRDAFCTDSVVDLLGREAAVLPPEELDDRAACSSAPTTRRPEAIERTFDPRLCHESIMIPILMTC